MLTMLVLGGARTLRGLDRRPVPADGACRSARACRHVPNSIVGAVRQLIYGAAADRLHDVPAARHRGGEAVMAYLAVSRGQSALRRPAGAARHQFQDRARDASPAWSGPTAPARPRSSTSSPAFQRPDSGTSLSATQARRPHAARDRPRRHRPHLPEPAPLHRSDRARQRHDRDRRAIRRGAVRRDPAAVPHRARAEAQRRGRDGVLESVGLAHKANDFARNLSYGQQKLLTIARVLATRRSCCCSTSRLRACPTPR